MLRVFNLSASSALAATASSNLFSTATFTALGRKRQQKFEDTIKETGPVLDGPFKADFLPCTLEEKKQLSEWFWQFKFGFPKDLYNSTMGTETGEHILIRKDGLMRYYSPISLSSQKGSVELVVRFYPPRKQTTPTKKPSMLDYFQQMRVGDRVEAKGPTGGLKYKSNMVKKLGMIAGGSGIAPMLQILREIDLNRKVDNTEVTMLYGAPNIESLVYKQEIDAIAQRDPLNKIKIHYFIDKLDQGLKAVPEGVQVGYITKEKMSKYLPQPNEHCLNVVCGPPQLEKMCQQALKDLGYERKQRYFY